MNTIQKLSEELLNEIATYIAEYQAEHGKSPSQAEIAEACGINTKRAFKYVQALHAHGRIELTDKGRILTPASMSDIDDFVPIPKVGIVQCGTPNLAVEDYDGVFRLPRQYLGSGEFFMLEASGESMIDAGIYDGDLLVIRRQNEASSGDIVVAWKSEWADEAEATLKTYRYNQGDPILVAENENKRKFPDIPFEGFNIIGKLKCVIRDMELVK